MKEKNVDTIIIGGGVAGLGCAFHLAKNNDEFILISPDLGGRIRSSVDGVNNYGAFFVCNDYHNFLPFVTLGPRIRLRDFCFHDDLTNYVLYSHQIIPYLGDFIKIRRILRRFRKRFRQFRKCAEHYSQKTLIEQDPWLHRLYMMDATDFIEELAIEKGVKKYLSYGLYSTTFSPVTAMNAFSFLEFLLPLITPIYMFRFEKERLILSFKEKIIHDSVSAITMSNGLYLVKTKMDVFSAQNLVLATEIGWSAPFAEVSGINNSVATHMLHLSGTPSKEISRKRFHLFTYPSNLQAIALLEDGTYLVYYRDVKPDPTRFFTDPNIIADHFWDPAGRIDGHNLIESNRGKNLYLIGDYNIVGLEESFITGIFAANQILKSEK